MQNATITVKIYLAISYKTAVLKWTPLILLTIKEPEELLFIWLLFINI